MVPTAVQRLAFGVVATLSVVGASLLSFSSATAQSAQSAQSGQSGQSGQSVQTAQAASDAAFQGPDAPVAFILDASRSMLGQVEGRRRMDVARDAMLQLVPGPLQQGRASLVSFGNDAINECDAIPVIHPFGDARVGETLAAIAALEPAEPGAGEVSRVGSPLYRSIEVALSTLPDDSETGSIVMVTDGVDACSRDICELVPVLQERGVSVDILAIDVNPNLLNLLACVPAGTGGALLPSDNLPTIESYARLLSRAARPKPVDVQPYLDEIGRLTAELAAMKRERDDLEYLRRQLDADLLAVFAELDEANARIAALSADLALAEAQSADRAALSEALEQARLTLTQLQDRIVALDAAVVRCENERTALEAELSRAAQRISELENAEPEIEIREVTKIVPDQQVVADLARAKATLQALGCPFEAMDACEPVDGGREDAMLAEIDRLRARLADSQNEISDLKRERGSILDALASSEKLVQRMVDGLALTASTYVSGLGEDYAWDKAVADNSAAGLGMASVRANRALMATVSREQQVQIIQSDTSGLEGEVEALTAQLAAERRNLEAAQTLSADLRADLSQALGARDRARVERDGLTRRLEQLVERTRLVGDERNAAVKLAEERLSEILRLTTALQEQNDQVKRLAADFNSLSEERDGFQAEARQQRVAADDAAAMIDSLTTEVTGLQAALTQAQAERDLAQDDRVVLLEDLAKLDHTVETLLAKNRELQTAMDAVSARAASDREQAETAAATAATLRTERDDQARALSAAAEQIDALKGAASALENTLEQITVELNAAETARAAVREENSSLVLVLDELRADLDLKSDQVLNSEAALESLRARLKETETKMQENEASLTVLIAQCTALLGFEGEADSAADRETLAFECAAAFESAQRWRADLTEMLEVRDRGLQACEARFAALETQAQAQALAAGDEAGAAAVAGSCPGEG